MFKSVHFGNEGRQKLLKGVNLIADSVKTTLGPRGLNVIAGNHWGYPTVTKDGVTVARIVESTDAVEQIGLLMVRQVAQQTADSAGDGTTTACVLAQSIFTEGLKALSTGANAILIKRGIDEAVIKAVEFIKSNAKVDPSDEELLKISTISTNNDPVLGALIYEAIKKAGKDGVITIEDNYRNAETFVETIEGMQLNEGYVSPYLYTDREKMTAKYENAYVLIADYEISHPKPLMKAVTLAMEQEKRPLIIIAHNITGQALESIVASKHKNGIPILACKAPYFGDNRTDQLTDLAVLTGGRVIGATTGVTFESLELTDLGQTDSVLATKAFTTFTGGKGKSEDVKARIEVLQNAINVTESDYDRAKLQERLAKLTSGVSVLRVGAPSEVERKEKKMRVEDALHACRSAIEEGIISGGGVALLKASKYLETLPLLNNEAAAGMKIVIQALKDPIKQIATNSGLDGSEIIASILSGHGSATLYIDGKPRPFQDSITWGYDFLNNQYGNLIEMGIIDPVKVVRLTLENAASVSGMLLTSAVVIAEHETVEAPRTPKAH